MYVYLLFNWFLQTNAQGGQMHCGPPKLNFWVGRGPPWPPCSATCKKYKYLNRLWLNLLQLIRSIRRTYKSIFVEIGLNAASMGECLKYKVLSFCFVFVIFSYWPKYNKRHFRHSINTNWTDRRRAEAYTNLWNHDTPYNKASLLHEELIVITSPKND